MKPDQVKNIVEAALFAADKPLTVDKLLAVFAVGEVPEREQIRKALQLIAEETAQRCIELKQVSSGYRLQVRPEYAAWVSRLWDEKPGRYSRALLETLALIAYRQPITRAEIEDVRGVSVSTSILRTLSERDWIVIVGHRNVPGKPALYGTTRQFLNDFNLKTLDQLPPLSDLSRIEPLAEQLALLEEAASRDSSTGTPAMDQMAAKAEEATAPPATDLGEHGSFVPPKTSIN